MGERSVVINKIDIFAPVEPVPPGVRIDAKAHCVSYEKNDALHCIGAIGGRMVERLTQTVGLLKFRESVGWEPLGVRGKVQ